jgi:hypothetical protein
VNRVILQADMEDFAGHALDKTDSRIIAHPNTYIRLVIRTYKSIHPTTPMVLHRRFSTLHPILENIPFPREPHTLFTDGSFTHIHPNPLAEVIFPDQHTTAGGGAVVLLSDVNWATRPIHVVHLTGDATYPIHLAQSWELLSMLAALQLSSEHGFPIFSDCQGIVTKLNRISDISYWRSSDHQFLYSAAALLLSIRPTTISWTRSHPETRQRDRSKWSVQDWGIFIADQVAEGIFTVAYTSPAGLTFPLQLIIHPYPLSDLLRTLQISSSYHWTSTTTSLPSIYHPKSTWPASEHKAYLARRDMNYSPGITLRQGCGSLGHLPWHDRSFALASKAFSMSSASLSKRASIVRALWDWVVTGRKHVLWNPSAAGDCPTCSQAEDLRHILANCPHKELRLHRLRIQTLCSDFISTLRTELNVAQTSIPQPPTAHSLGSIINILTSLLQTVFTHHDGYQLLLGSFSPLHLTPLLPLLPLRPHHTFVSLFRKHLTSFLRILTSGALALIRIRNALPATTARRTATQRCMPAYMHGSRSSSSRTATSFTKRTVSSRHASTRTSSSSRPPLRLTATPSNRPGSTLPSISPIPSWARPPTTATLASPSHSATMAVSLPERSRSATSATPAPGASQHQPLAGSRSRPPSTAKAKSKLLVPASSRITRWFKPAPPVAPLPPRPPPEPPPPP